MKRVLVVEDDPAQLYLLASKLRRRGHEVGEATTLAEAQAVRAQYDLVISDQHLGPTERGTALYPGPPPVVIISGFPAPADYRGSWIEKPIDYAVLLQVLGPYLGE